jgi:dihydropyrimidinase
MSTLIKNGRIITAEEDHTADIFIENENISLIEKDLTIEADTIIDANGKFVIPGGIDVHTHLDMPYRGITTSSDDFETGTIAAAFGGTTTIIDFANQTKGKSLREGLETWMKKAEGKAVIDYSFHASVTDLVDNWQQEMKDLADEGVSQQSWGQ